MGTVLEVQVFAADPARARRLAREVFARVGELEALLSHYEPASDVTRLSRTAGGGPQRVDPRVSRVLRRSLELGELTGGAFDVTLGPVLAFWRDASGPGASLPAAVRARSGQDKLQVLPDGRVALLAPGMALDLGAVAKGWALDRSVEGLRKGGAEAALLSFGQSSVWALGAPPRTDGWTLALRAPGGGLQGTVTLRDQALSFSVTRAPEPPARPGEPPGRAPLVDPRTLRPVGGRGAVTVVAPDAALADALSTALLVLGPGEGRSLVKSLPGVEALIAERDGSTWQSPGWAHVTRYQPVAR